jgi:hypothetical protein
MGLTFYLPKLSDQELAVLRKLTSHMLLKAHEAGGQCVLNEWLFARLTEEADRREALELGDEIPEVQVLELPNWTDRRVGEALKACHTLTYLKLTPAQGQLIDEINLELMLTAKNRLCEANR